MSKEKKKEISEEELKKIQDAGTGHKDRLESIAQSVKKTHFEESGYEDIEDEETGEETKAEQDTQTDETDEKDEQKQDVKEDKPPDTDFIKLKVDGEEIEKPKSEVEKEGGVEAYQKKLAADRRLEQATLKQKEIEKREAELAKREAALGQKLPDTDDDDLDEETEEDPKQKDAVEDLKRLKDKVAEKRKAYHNAIEFGENDDIDAAADEYEAAQEACYEAKFQEGKPTQKQADLDVDEIADQIDKSLTKKKILSKFQKEFEDVWKDPEAKSRAEFEVDILLNAGKSGSEWSTYEEAGKRARQQMGWEEPEKKDPTPEQTEEEKKRQEKIEKKRKIENIDAATAKTEAPKTEEKPQSRKEVIEDMAAKRIGSHIY